MLEVKFEARFGVASRLSNPLQEDPTYNNHTGRPINGLARDVASAFRFSQAFIVHNLPDLGACLVHRAHRAPAALADALVAIIVFTPEIHCRD